MTIHTRVTCRVCAAVAATAFEVIEEDRTW
jgi:hypothetical protein